jgi:hypothetical protein
MRMREFESKLKKLTSVTLITYGRERKNEAFKLEQIFVHTAPGECHFEDSPDCMEKHLAYFENLYKKES